MAQLKTGDSLPEATFMTMGADGPAPKTTADVFAGKKVALFAVPGAYTPTCNNNHLPSYLTHADKLAAAGVDAIACVSVNDVFVMGAWAKSTGAEGKIHMLADGNGDFTKSVGMELDGSGHGLGLRSLRYAAMVEDGTVTALVVEDNPGEANQSSAEGLLAAAQG